MQCKVCGCNYVPDVGEDVKAVTCWKCVTRMTWPDELMDKLAGESRGYPTGWHFRKEFVDRDGNVFHKGNEQPELKGTLPPTVIKPKPKKKRKTKKEIRQENRRKYMITEREIKEIKKKIKDIENAGKKRGLITLNKQLNRKLKEQRKYV